MGEYAGRGRPTSRGFVSRPIARLPCAPSPISPTAAQAEQSVVVNATDFSEQIEVRLVEVAAVVHDQQGRPILDLEREDFRLLEDGSERSIERFERSSETPLAVALLIDRSISMEPRLRAVSEAAATFARGSLERPEDRVALLSFSDRPSLEIDWTADQAEVERRLASLQALGGTALHDAVVFHAQQRCTGARGRRTVGAADARVGALYRRSGRAQPAELRSDGRQRSACRASPSTPVGLESSFADRGHPSWSRATGRADRWARTGFATASEELPRLFDAVLEELRSRYLLAFSPGDGDEGYRPLRVEVSRNGAQVRARSGYWP